MPKGENPTPKKGARRTWRSGRSLLGSVMFTVPMATLMIVVDLVVS